MVNYELEERFAGYVGHGSLGMTNKYYRDGYWYKQNLKGYEGKSEAICSTILEYSDVPAFVKYEECQINGVNGCRSKNMVSEHETVVMLSRLYEYAYGGSLREKVNSYGLMTDRIEYVLDFAQEVVGLDLYDYLGTVLKFDMLTYDVDRHFNNLAVIRKDDGTYREAPLFDFGTFFLICSIFRPVTIRLDKDGIRKALEGEPVEIQEMLEYNLAKYSDLFPDFADARKKPEPGIRL